MSPSKDRNVPPAETNHIFVSGENTSAAEEKSEGLERSLEEDEVHGEEQAG